MSGLGAERIEKAVDRLAAALFAGAVGYAFFALLSGVYPEPQLGVFSAGAAGIAYLICVRLLAQVEPAARRFDAFAFDLRPLDHADELLLSEQVELLLTEQVELVLTDADRLRPPAASSDVLMLDDILAEIGTDSRVVRLFDPAAMPTPGQLNDRIARHIREGASPVAAPPDASQALHDALAELRRSLR